MPDTRHSNFTPPLDTQLQKDVIQERIFELKPNAVNRQIHLNVFEGVRVP